MTRRPTKARELGPSENARVFMALAVQPIVAALVTVILFPLLAAAERARTGLMPGSSWDSASSIAFAVALVAVGITLLGAMPLLAIQLSQGPVSIGQIFASGFALGNLPTAASWVLMAGQIGATGLSGGSSQATALLPVMVLGSVLGLSGAAVFAWIAGDAVGPTNGMESRES
ncbi:MAG: hypothetical protein U0163_00085 [Gemmatimonadaceae bacterium]